MKNVSCNWQVETEQQENYISHKCANSAQQVKGDDRAALVVIKQDKKKNTNECKFITSTLRINEFFFFVVPVVDVWFCLTQYVTVD